MFLYEPKAVAHLQNTSFLLRENCFKMATQTIVCDNEIWFHSPLQKNKMPPLWGTKFEKLEVDSER